MIKSYLHDQILSSLELIACKNDVYILNSNELNSSVPDTALIKTRGIIMNTNFDVSVDYTYRLAHELCHILYGDSEAQAVYHFSEFGKRGEELLAHKNAIRLLMSIKMPSSPLTFMKYYSISTWLESDVIKIFTKLSVVE